MCCLTAQVFLHIFIRETLKNTIPERSLRRNEKKNPSTITNTLASVTSSAVNRRVGYEAVASLPSFVIFHWYDFLKRLIVTPPPFARKTDHSLPIFRSLQTRGNLSSPQRDGQNLPRDRTQIMGGNLTIRGLRKSDHATYECEVRNGILNSLVLQWHFVTLFKYVLNQKTFEIHTFSPFVSFIEISIF